MPNLYLHAGAPKTGTSFLQVLFAKYADRLEQAGVIYPAGHLFDEAKAGEITSGNGVGMANYIRPHLPHRISDKGAFIFELEAQLKRAAGKHVLYSSEWLFFDPGARTAEISRVAVEAGYEIRVIYLIRDIAPAAFSVYSQEIKNNGETRAFSEFIKDWDAHYRSSIQKVIDTFGRGSLIVYNFEEHRDRLAELFFGDILEAGFVPEDRAKINRSLTPKEAEMVRLMNTAYPRNARFSSFVSSALIGIEAEPEPFLVTTEESELLHKRFGPAVEYVNSFVSGEPTVVARRILDARQATKLSDFERSMMAIVAKLVSAVVK